MASQHRLRSSTAASIPLPSTEALTVLNESLEHLAAATRQASGNTDVSTLLTRVLRVLGALENAPADARAKDAFRHKYGFSILLETLRTTSGFYNSTTRNEDEKKEIFELLSSVLSVLSETFRGHYGNQRYFKQRVEGGGWAALEQAIASIGFGVSDSDSWTENQLFGTLLAFAADDGRLRSICQDVQECYTSKAKGMLGHDEAVLAGRSPDSSSPVQPSKEDNNESHDRDVTSESAHLEWLQKKIASMVGDKTLLPNAEIAPTIITFWRMTPRDRPVQKIVVSLTTIEVFKRVTSFSESNLLALHSTGVLSALLPFAFDENTGLSTLEQRSVEDLCNSLMSLGLSALNDARYLLRSRTPRAMDFLLRMSKISHDPPHIQFDLSLNGYSCLELNLGRQFPPPSTSPGYTFSAWVYIDHFDPSVHTTIFGVLDPTQTCFVLAYLERDTHNFILQTSVNSSRPSVRFKTIKFQERRWYHVAFVHRRPKTMSSSKAALYVNGEFAEQVKIQYPTTPPPINLNGSTESFASFASSASSKLSPVQAFVGTPHDLATRLGQGLVSSKWSLASAHLFDDVLSDDYLAVHFRLGPRYNGNFQDCLGSFQTYEASAALSMRNEALHPGKDEKSDIITAIRDKGSNIIPEHRLIVSILPTAIISDESKGENDASQLIRGLSKSASNNLYQIARLNGGFVALNGAIPSINEALVRLSGTCTLAGEPVVVVPQALDNAMWRLGGCSAIGLKLVESAISREEIVRAVEILFESINGSWRNSEAMERDNGYMILGALLRGKIGAGSVIAQGGNGGGQQPNPLSRGERDKLSFELLSLVLGFVGYDHATPENSAIVNPLAYRTLLVDFDMWRKTAPITQKLYYKQFSTFSVKTKFHAFNSKRLLRMRVVKKFLDALKAETFLAEVFPSFLEALLSLVKGSLTAEVFRALALFVTYALHKPMSQSRTPARDGFRPGINSSRISGLSNALRKPVVNTATDAKKMPGDYLTKRDLAIGVLELYTDLLCENGSIVNLKKFATTVTNKWLLHLLTEDEPQIVVLGTKILARLLVVHGSAYVSKFADKNGGFVVMRHRLRRWWDVPALWPILFSILFSYDVAEIDFEKNFELFSLLEIFGNCKVVYPGVLPIMTAMLQQGLNSLSRSQDDPDSPARDKNIGNGTSDQLAQPVTSSRSRSMSLNKDMKSQRSLKTLHKSSTGTDNISEPQQPRLERLGGQATVLHTVIRFLSDIHSNSSAFKDFAMQSEYVRHLLLILYPAIVSADVVSAEIELNSREGALTFEGDDVVIRPSSRVSTQPTPIVRASAVESELGSSPNSTPSHESTRPRAPQLRRGSSFILLTSRVENSSPQDRSPSTAKLTGVIGPPKKQIATIQFSHAVIEELLELVVAVFIDQVIARKEFPGFGLFLKVPPGFQEHQAYFESYILRNTISQLSNTIKLDQKLLWEPRVITNMARFCLHMGEAVYEGWFLSGAEPLLDFAGDLLDYLQRPDVAKIKSVRLCSQAVLSIRSVFLRVALLRLSEIDGQDVPESEALAFMNKLLYWQTVVLSAEINQQEDFLKLICYQLYTKLVDSREQIQLAAANLWRILLVQKPDETSAILAMSMGKRALASGFKKLMELDNETFMEWVKEHRLDLDALFFGSMSRAWEDFVNTENAKTDETAKSRVNKRKDRLKQWYHDDKNNEDILFRNALASNLWRKNIYDSEHLKHQRALQDQQDNFAFIARNYSKMERDLRRPCAVFDDESPYKWQLDRTEGRNRMRLRMLPDRSSFALQDYQPKRKTISEGSAPNGLRVNTKIQVVPSAEVVGATPTLGSFPGIDGNADAIDADAPQDGSSNTADGARSVHEDEFELVDDPNGPNEDGYEDKNRKVMRSLERGDQVQQVFNISRIIGLESCEGLLILGKDSLYLIDNVFQRSDGEIVDVWQAPVEERDPYLQMISGQKAVEKPKQKSGDQESRSWKWSQVLSISKRRFLFRDVAIEVFFTDGRSYLLTAISQVLRDDLHIKLQQRAPHTSGGAPLPNPEDAWRLDSLRVQDEAPTGFGSKFGSIFNSSAWNPAMRRWAKGEISNFHYLMLVNTMAGRTMNDLTQYPVFPWVLADYTSEELDLDNPSTFRDLSKPMGAQHASRAADFVERYKSFADMGDQPPFHYGTHYSSAMIVTSYLIRLQPFVQSYLLLQGGNFDHPDRLFFSIEKAWASSSRDNMTDVRELIPEFFFLPEFLTNSNGYNFGLRQGTGGAIDNVALPPWAKGDPKIFIAKNREALESPYVSRHLHQWIDLIFGSKQRGEAAIENVNVFHHLSYHGAKDLDAIEDEHERSATISIIHNFGQTPHQIFSRPHQARDDVRNKPKRLDAAAESLTKLPFPLFETHEAIHSLIYSSRLDRLLHATAFRLNIGPYFDKYMEWGYSDNSIRFFTSDGKKLIGIVENAHQGQISAAAFADSRTLVTAGVDCVISAWNLLLHNTRTATLQPKASLFGHKEPVSTIIISRSFSTILSASTDGQVFLWDLNRLEFVRKLALERPVECAQINDISGDIMLCRGQKVTLYTLNGDIILDQNVCSDHDDYIASCAFYEGTGNEWLENCLIFTGHRKGVVNVWKKTVKKGRNGGWCLALVKRLDHVADQRSEEGSNTSAAITCIRPMPTMVYTGDEDGRIYEWDCVQRER